jgi:hypothetical protein
MRAPARSGARAGQRAGCGIEQLAELVVEQQHNRQAAAAPGFDAPEELAQFADVGAADRAGCTQVPAAARLGAGQHVLEQNE